MPCTARLLLVRSESLYFKLSGFGAAGIMVLPVLIALVAYWRHGGFAPETGLLNRDDVAEPDAAPATAAARSDSPADADSREAHRWRSSAARCPRPTARSALACVGRAARCWLWDSPRSPSPSATSANRPITACRATGRAPRQTGFVRSRGVDPAAFHYVTYPAARWNGSDSLAGKYFLEACSGARRLPPSSKRKPPDAQSG